MAASSGQHEDTRQILRDIESRDGHTSFLFNKINFLIDATVGFIHFNQNKRVPRLTTISIVFVPINTIGGMSGYSMMTADIPWPVPYDAFTLAMDTLGFGTYHARRHFEQLYGQQTLAARQRKEV